MFSGERFHWVEFTPDRPAEPALVEYQDDKPVRVWFIGMEDEMDADRCKISEQIVREKA